MEVRFLLVPRRSKMKVQIKGYNKPWVDQPTCTDQSDFVKIKLEFSQRDFLELIAAAAHVAQDRHSGAVVKLNNVSLNVYVEGSQLSGKGELLMVAEKGKTDEVA